VSPTTENCRPDTIQRFLRGDLSISEMTVLEQHLDQCDSCDSELIRQTAEPEFWNDAKAFLSSTTPATDAPHGESPADIENELTRLLDPTDDPQMLGRFGGYEIRGIVGRGGMGVVMKGMDVSLNRFVAIKILNSALGSTSAGRQRFAREAQAAAAVVHENVIAIHGVDQWNGTPYLIMPYIKGESLQQRIQRTAPLSLENMMEISLQIARGLAAAHDQGLIHRDIKPANILMPESVSRILITDFGLARTADDVSLTCSGVISGTPQYMSPEQAKGEAVDARTDLFSLGSVMYAMACGHPPFRADTSYGVLRRITDHPHRKLSQIQSSTPAWVESIIDRLLEKEPDDRFESAHQLAETLEECLAHVRQPTVSQLPKIASSGKSQGWLALVLLGVLATAVIAIGLTYWSKRADSKTPETVKTQTQNKQTPVGSSTFAWEYDDSDLVQLEQDLNQLLSETK